MADKITSVQGFIEDNLKNEITDYNNPKCINCNDCCSLATIITKAEYNKIKKYLTTDVNGIALHKKGKELMSRHLKNGTIYFKCPLSLEHSRKCGIYSIRPQICRDFHCKKELSKIHSRPSCNEEGYIIADLFINRKGN